MKRHQTTRDAGRPSPSARFVRAPGGGGRRRRAAITGFVSRRRSWVVCLGALELAGCGRVAARLASTLLDPARRASDGGAPCLAGCPCSGPAIHRSAGRQRCKRRRPQIYSAIFQMLRRIHGTPQRTLLNSPTRSGRPLNLRNLNRFGLR